MLSLMAAALLATTASAPQQIDIARANWENYPRLETERLAVPNGDMVRRVQLMLQRDECELEGQSARRFDVDVNYAVMFDPRGRATRIVVEDVGCRVLETYVGNIVRQILDSGYVRAPSPAEASWFANRINFNLQ